MNKVVLVSMLALLGATRPSLAQLEDAVKLAENGLVIRGTVLDSSTEGKDAPIPRIEPGAEPFLYSTWRVRIDDCYYPAGGDCASKIGETIDIAAITGAAIEREGTRRYEELITNSATLAVTAPLEQGGSLLLLVRPSSRRAGSYEIVPPSIEDLPALLELDPQAPPQH